MEDFLESLRRELARQREHTDLLEKLLKYYTAQPGNGVLVTRTGAAASKDVQNCDRREPTPRVGRLSEKTLEIIKHCEEALRRCSSGVMTTKELLDSLTAAKIPGDGHLTTGLLSSTLSRNARFAQADGRRGWMLCAVDGMPSFKDDGDVRSDNRAGPAAETADADSINDRRDTAMHDASPTSPVSTGPDKSEIPF